MKISSKRKTLILSFMVMLVSLISFTMTTFAWFSDSASSLNNIVKVGNLDAKMYWTDNVERGEWHDIEDSQYNAVFTYDNYEPGYTELKYIKIVNNGTLAYKYDLSLLAMGQVGELAEVVDVYSLSDVTRKVSSVSDMNKCGVLKNTLGKSLAYSDVLLPEGTVDGINNTHEVVVAIALQMQESAGNEYQGKSIGDGFSIRLTATQFNSDSEQDSFGSDYDKEATFPVTITTNVSTSNGLVDKETTMSTGLVNAVIPTGVKVEPGTKALTLTVTEKDETESNVTVSDNEKITSLDVHISGVAQDNEVPMKITINQVADKYLNKGNIELYHVENGQTIAMTEVNSTEELVSHNQFYYDSATGTFVISIASFSEVTTKVKTDNAWTGNIDTTWYNTNAKEFAIYNADQLAGLSAIVGGMKGLTRDNFEGKTIKLISDINLGDAEETNNESIVFYPIGYYNNTEDYVKNSGNNFTFKDDRTSVYSTVKSFNGTFDGNGHTVANFYQNTWEMFGDYNSGYSGTPNHYRDAFGLFGWVVNGTVKNLHVKNFSCDSEYGISGIVAAYSNNSTYENIAITDCNPRVYNNGNGGIVGYVGAGNDENDATSTMTFQNITIDNSNKITALWGTWDGCCAGILGRYNSESKVILNNCHVAAQMDVFNDVCGNYQYYWYRYSAMLVGSIEKHTTNTDGYIIPDTSKFVVDSCTVHFGEWNNYYYCELVENTLASYTHDHQMSRLTLISSLSEIKQGDEWLKTGNFMTLANDGTRTCYHIRKDAEGKLYQHLHSDSGEEVVNGETVLKEDKQCIYLPFNQVYQGYGWGVQNIPVNKANGVTILDEHDGESVVKFEAASNNIKVDINTPVSLSNLFKAVSQTTSGIHNFNVQVHVSYVDESGNPVDGGFTYNPNTTNWANGTLSLAKAGTAYVTISDYIFCTETTIAIHVHEYSTEYTSDGTYHWHKCLDSSCTTTTTKEKHTNGTAVVTKYPSVSSKGEWTSTCTACTHSSVENNRLVYLDAKTWESDNAWFAVYYFDAAGNNGWAKMTKNDTFGELYSAFIPASMTKVIFVRMNKNTTELSWDSKWNQTGNISLTSNVYMLKYKIEAYGSNGADSTHSSYGKWSPDITLRGTFNSWDSNAKFSQISEDLCVYTLELSAGSYTFKVVHGSTWYGNNGTIDDTTTKTSSSGWEMKTAEGNCTLKTSGGTYTFLYNPNTKALVILHH